MRWPSTYSERPKGAIKLLKVNTASHPSHDLDPRLYRTSLKTPEKVPRKRSVSQLCETKSAPKGSTWSWIGPFGIHCTPKLTEDRKSTRLNSSHLVISYAVFCLKKK